MPHSSSSPATNALGPFDKVWRYFSSFYKHGCSWLWLLSTGQRLCWKTYSEQDIPTPTAKYPAPKFNSAQVKKSSALAPVRTLWENSTKAGKIIRQLTLPCYSLENDAFGKRSQDMDARKQIEQEVTLGSQRDMYSLHLHSYLWCWVSGREGMVCVFGVGTWDHEEIWPDSCVSTQKTESVGSIGQARKKHRECHFSRRHADGNKRHLRGHRRGPMTKTQKRG